MKTAHIIIGVLVCFLATASTASAEGFDLSLCNENGGISVERVFSSYGGSTITISVTDFTGAKGRIDKVGFVLSPFTTATVVDNKGKIWDAKDKGKTSQMGGFGQYYEYDRTGSKATSVTITFSGPITGTPKLAAHVAWGTGSAFFAGPGPTNSIPEFPSVAIPIAAVLGIMFIFVIRRKE